MNCKFGDTPGLAVTFAPNVHR